LENIHDWMEKNHCWLVNIHCYMGIIHLWEKNIGFVDIVENIQSNFCIIEIISVILFI